VWRLRSARRFSSSSSRRAVAKGRRETSYEL
jgi:hypothetical protein